MKELALQKFLRAHPDNWYGLLKAAPYDLIINEKDDRVIFKYVQFASDFSQELVREARGIILEKESWNVVCLPFGKFFNYGEVHAYDIDLNKSTIFEKVDGSIIKLYFYNDEWHVATNGTIDADDAATFDDRTTFKDLFFDVMPSKEFELFTSGLDVNYTFLFELIHPMNRVVVDYEGKKELIFLGMRDNLTHKDVIPQLPVAFLPDMVRYPKRYTLEVNDLSELSAVADQINNTGADFEGFIVAETDGNLVAGRVKIKSPKYLMLHRLTDKGSASNSILDILLEGEEDEFEAYLNLMPEHIKAEYYATKEKFIILLGELEHWFLFYKNMSEKVTRKELALAITSGEVNRYSGWIFTHIDRGGSPLELLRKSLSPTKKLKYLLKYKDKGLCQNSF